MTFLELCKRTAMESGVSSSGPVSVNGQVEIMAKIVSWVRQAEQNLCAMRDDWSFLWRDGVIQLVQEQRTYSLFELGLVGANRIVSIKAGARKLRAIPYDHFCASNYDIATEIAEPVTYSVRPDGKIAFYPLPPSALTLRVEYFIRPAPMQLDADVTPVPAEHHRVIIDDALMQYAAHDEDTNLFAVASARYQVGLSHMSNQCLPAINVRFS